MYSDQALVRRALHSGAKGYVLKTAVADELIQAVKAVYRGEVYLSPVLQEVILTEFLTRSGEDSNPVYRRLTPRERQVLQLIAAGHSNTSIANILGLKVRTVQKHRGNLMAKLDVHDVPGLVRVALRSSCRPSRPIAVPRFRPPDYQGSTLAMRARSDRPIPTAFCFPVHCLPDVHTYSQSINELQCFCNACL